MHSFIPLIVTLLTIHHAKGKYQTLTSKRKLQIEEASDCGSSENLTPRQEEERYCYRIWNPSSTILKNKETLKASHAVGSFKKIRHRDPTRTDVDESLFQWFTAARAHSVEKY